MYTVIFNNGKKDNIKTFATFEKALKTYKLWRRLIFNNLHCFEYLTLEIYKGRDTLRGWYPFGY